MNGAVLSPPHLGFLYTAPNPLEQPPLVAGAVDVVVVACSTSAVVEATAEHQPSYVDNIMNLGLCVTRGFTCGDSMCKVK